MSYDPYRDNTDLAEVSERARAELAVICHEIDKSSWKGQHADQCGCDRAVCNIRAGIEATSAASAMEALGWLCAKDMLADPEDGNR